MNYSWIVNICAGIGIICIIHFIYIFILSKRNKNWKITEGEIISSKMQESLDVGAMYQADIQYKYVIGEKEYFSKRIFYGHYLGKNFPKSIKTLINKYVKGKKVLVYYNPKHPDKSVLETGVHTIIYQELFAGILFVVLSIVMKIHESFFIFLIQ